jgi:alginate O-acetyltransferase complex protein AlgJ
VTTGRWPDPYHLGRLIRDGRVVQGKGGWLFLGSDYLGDVMARHDGTWTLSSEELERWRALLEDRTARLAEKGVPYFFVVAPDTHSIYPEMLPAGFEPTAERPVHRLLAHLERAGSKARALYPLEDLLAAKAKRPVASAFDSHWNQFGALVAYVRLMRDVAEVVPVREIDPARMQFATRTMPADLRFKLGFDDEVDYIAAVFQPDARLVEDNQVDHHGSLAVTECNEAPPTTCVLFGDSYSIVMMRFLAESFRRLVFANTLWFDYELLEREQPDVVISLFAERFLVFVPDDSANLTIEMLARPKLADGVTRPRLPWWG